MFKVKINYFYIICLENSNTNNDYVHNQSFESRSNNQKIFHAISFFLER